MDSPSGSDTSAASHPEMEELAAFIDGRLGPRQCAHIRSHLARCADCYEVFAGTVRYQREHRESVEGRVVPFPFAGKPRWQARWGMAAAVGAAAGMILVLGFVGYRALVPSPVTAEIEVVELVREPLAGRAEALMPELLPRVKRGPAREEMPPMKRSFQLGVDTLNLQMSLHAGDRDRSLNAVARIGLLLADSITTDGELESFYQQLNEELASERPTRDLLGRAAAVADGGFEGHIAPFDPLFCDFGQWAAAARLAAISREPSFFAQDDVRRFPRMLQQRAGKQLDQAGVADDLADISIALAQGDLADEEYRALASSLERILRTYY